jgi:enediyne biosynthesis protein E4
MFLNEGNLKFKDITEQTGITYEHLLPKWSTGASVVDINNDGLLDIYVNNIGDHLNVKGFNQLYVCQQIKNGIPQYKEMSQNYGLDLKGFSTQTVFFDYDLDGDLDVYQLNHSLHQNGTFGPRKNFEGKQHLLSGDKLLRNNIVNKGGPSTEKFEEVTLAAGIGSTVIGYGLGIVTGDVNNDGWPDIYVGNDFHENDYLYINQKNGTFKEVLADRIRHTSRFSMGVDMADINNDGWSEIMSLDMMPEDNEILRRSLGEDGFAVYQFKLGYGYKEQFARNNLQLNNGDPSVENGQVPSFSEIGFYAGVNATDWSWATLFMDFDCDGYNDIFISNGIPRRMNDIDYTNFMNNDEGVKPKPSDSKLDVVEKMPKIKIKNKFFNNQKNLKFEDLQATIENDKTSYSNGSVYGDFDNDGDLDVVVNNIEDEPFLYQNLLKKDSISNSIKIKFKGSKYNVNAIGTRVLAFKKDGTIISSEHYSVRGYQSSTLQELTIGIGDTMAIDSVLVIWPDLTCQKLSSISYNKTMDLVWKDGLSKFDFSILHLKKTMQYELQKVDKSKSGLVFVHVENLFIEFNRELLIPHMVSTEGPALAKGDVNGDGLEDLFFGSSKRVKSAIYLQKSNGTFELHTPQVIAIDSVYEDVDAKIIDIDGDLDNDILVAAGGNEYKGKEDACKQRYYINNGKGDFTKYYFDGVYMTASCVLVGDYDNDKKPDVFLGARSIPWKYGMTPTSAILKNIGNGNFKNESSNFGNLKEVGLVKNGQWIDIDNDQDQDLVLAMEWAPITIIENNKGSFKKKEINTTYGWWNTVLCHDFDNDGDIDILGGNTGLNGRFHPNETEPVKLYVYDFDGNGQVEQILTHFQNHREVPFATHAELIKQLPSLKKKFLYAKDFAKADVAELIGKDKLKKSIVKQVNNLASMYFENNGKGVFTGYALPAPFQFSTQNAFHLTDINNDGKKEVLTAGNFFECNIEMGRYDSDYGHILEIGSNHNFTYQSLSNLGISGQVRRINEVKTVNGIKYIYAINNGPVCLIEVKSKASKGKKN